MSPLWWNNYLILDFFPRRVQLLKQEMNSWFFFFSWLSYRYAFKIGIFKQIQKHPSHIIIIICEVFESSDPIVIKCLCFQNLDTLVQHKCNSPCRIISIWVTVVPLELLVLWTLKPFKKFRAEFLYRLMENTKKKI